MADTILFALRRGETRTVTFALFDAAGAAFNTTGYTVTFAADGNGTHTTKTATLDSPASLGTGSFAFTASETLALKPTTRGRKRLTDPLRFVIWAKDAGTNELVMLDGFFDVDDVPART